MTTVVPNEKTVPRTQRRIKLSEAPDLEVIVTEDGFTIKSADAHFSYRKPPKNVIKPSGSLSQNSTLVIKGEDQVTMDTTY